jgi:hypothetical protein
MDERLYGRMISSKGGGMDRWMDGWMDGWMDS